MIDRLTQKAQGNFFVEGNELYNVDEHGESMRLATSVNRYLNYHSIDIPSIMGDKKVKVKFWIDDLGLTIDWNPRKLMYGNNSLEDLTISQMWTSVIHLSKYLGLSFRDIVLAEIRSIEIGMTAYFGKYPIPNPNSYYTSLRLNKGVFENTTYFKMKSNDDEYKIYDKKKETGATLKGNFLRVERKLKHRKVKNSFRFRDLRAVYRNWGSILNDLHQTIRLFRISPQASLTQYYLWLNDESRIRTNPEEFKWEQITKLAIIIGPDLFMSDLKKTPINPQSKTRYRKRLRENLRELDKYTDLDQNEFFIRATRYRMLELITGKPGFYRDHLDRVLASKD